MMRSGIIRQRTSFISAPILLTWMFLAMAVSADAQPAGSANAPASAEYSTSNYDSQPSQESREASGEDEQAQFKHSASVQLVAKITGLSLEHAYWLCVLLNFAVVAGTIFWFSKKNLPSVFHNRTNSIQKAMQEARQASEEANRRLAGIETRLSRLDMEIGSMRNLAEKEAADEEARIKAAAEQDARKIVESAEQEIAAAAKLARRELTAYAADLAVSLAAKQIKVDAATDQALVRGFARELSAKNPNGVATTTGEDRH